MNQHMTRQKPGIRARIRVGWHAFRGRPTIANCYFHLPLGMGIPIDSERMRDVLVQNCVFDGSKGSRALEVGGNR